MADFDLTLDSSTMTSPKRVQLDGEAYTMRPMRSREFYTMQKNQKVFQALQDEQTEENLSKAYAAMKEVVTPLMSPRNKFEQWTQSVEEQSEIAAAMMFSQLLQLAVKM